MNPTEKLQELFLRFPGIGPKQAARFVYFLLRERAEYKLELAKNIEYLKDTAHICKRCLRVFGRTNYHNEKDICEICNNPNREDRLLMVIAKELDIDAIEKTNLYNGKYFVLGSTLPFLTEKPSEVINIRELVKLISENLQNSDPSQPSPREGETQLPSDVNPSLGKVPKAERVITEIIFALPATDEGENTIDYLKKTLSQIVGIDKIKMSTLARGLSTGLDIEYVDKNTFNQAFTHRE